MRRYKTRKTRKNKKITRRKITRRNKNKYYKKGGAPMEETFTTKEDLVNYLNKNKSWISRVDVKNKDNYENNTGRADYLLDKSNFSQLYELKGDVKNYVFLFY